MCPRIALFLSLGLILGCGSDAKFAPVSGKVTLDGAPLGNAHVAFQPMGKAGSDSPGAGSYGVTDPDGKFTLRSGENDQPGAIVGKHRVEINIKADSSDADPRTRASQPKIVLPMKYNRQSELTFEVPAGGSDKANFDIVTKK
jgi:hypothetical protein